MKIVFTMLFLGTSGLTVRTWAGCGPPQCDWDRKKVHAKILRDRKVESDVYHYRSQNGQKYLVTRLSK